MRIIAAACICFHMASVSAYSIGITNSMVRDKSRIIGETRGANAREILYMVDQNGVPLVDARIHGSFWPGGNGKEYILVDGLTNVDGEYIAEGISKWKLTYWVTKEGYYKSSGQIDYLASTNVPVIKDGKWQPYGTTRIVPLRKIKNLGKLRVFPDSKRMCRWKIPALDRWIGFDLEAFDWVEPVGTGKHDDVLIRFRSEMKNQYFDFRFDMDISFTNNPCAGVYECKKDKFSMFEWAYNANTNKVFKDSLSFMCEKRPGKRGVTKCLAEDSYLVFRTRTKVDENGNLKEAHYGVISGEWTSGSETMRISDACFNPITNDTNIEDGYYLRKKVQWSKESKQ